MERKKNSWEVNQIPKGTKIGDYFLFYEFEKYYLVSKLESGKKLFMITKDDLSDLIKQEEINKKKGDT